MTRERAGLGPPPAERGGIITCPTGLTDIWFARRLNFVTVAATNGQGMFQPDSAGLITLAVLSTLRQLDRLPCSDQLFTPLHTKMDEGFLCHETADRLRQAIVGGAENLAQELIILQGRSNACQWPVY